MFDSASYPAIELFERVGSEAFDGNLGAGLTHWDWVMSEELTPERLLEAIEQMAAHTVGCLSWVVFPLRGLRL